MVQTKAERTQQKIIDACQALILQKGYSATSVEDICQASGMTKGGFFYHFATKEEAGRAAMRRWSAQGCDLMGSTVGANPLERLFNCLDAMVAVATDPGMQVGCVVGTISQEAGPSVPGLASVAWESFEKGNSTITQMIVEAAEYLGITPESEDEFTRIVWSLQAAFQGSMVMARAKGDASIITVVIDDFKRSLRARFGVEQVEV